MNETHVSRDAQIAALTPERWPSADPAAVARLLDRPFQVVAGKGGVGRTALASAIALRSARAGTRTLLLEVNAPDNAARFLGVAASPDEPREVRDHLWLCRMTPAGSLREYALMILRFRALYRLVFENRLVKYLLRSIPSLAEFTLAGKTWYHAVEKMEGSEEPRFERVIVDAPATGHAMTFLSVSRVVADTVPAGIMRTAAERMASLVESKDSTCLHIAALPEEMPVNEALELARFAREQLRMTLGIGFVNRMRPPLLHLGEDEVLQRLARSEDAAVRPYVAAAQRRLDLEALQREHAQRFAGQSGLPTICVRELPHHPRLREFLECMVEALDEAAGTAHQARHG